MFWPLALIGGRTSVSDIVSHHATGNEKLAQLLYDGIFEDLFQFAIGVYFALNIVSTGFGKMDLTSLISSAAGFIYIFVDACFTFWKERKAIVTAVRTSVAQILGSAPKQTNTVALTNQVMVAPVSVPHDQDQD